MNQQHAYQSTRYRSEIPGDQNPDRRWLKGLILFAIVVVIVFGSAIEVPAYLHRRHLAEVAKANAATQREMGEAIAAIIKKYPSITTGVATINGVDGLRGNYGNRSPFTAASTTKVLCAALLMHEIEKGHGSLQAVPDPSFNLSDFTAAFELQEMINDSDNDAWTALIDYVGGNSALQAYAQSIGLTSYNADLNMMTAADEAMLLQKLYDNTLLTKKDTDLILSYMQHTNDDNLIPSAVPPEVTLYHKYGLLSEGEIHDAAIMVFQSKPMFLVIYSDGPNISDYSTTRLQMFQAVTRAFLKYAYGLNATTGHV